MSNLAKYERSKLMQGANAFHHRVSRKGKEMLEMANEAGERLNALKADTPHGQWLACLDAEFEGSRQKAWRYMRINDNWAEIQSKCFTVLHFGIVDAIKLLQPPAALPPSDEVSLEEKHPHEWVTINRIATEDGGTREGQMCRWCGCDEDDDLATLSCHSPITAIETPESRDAPPVAAKADAQGVPTPGGSPAPPSPPQDTHDDETSHDDPPAQGAAEDSGPSRGASQQQQDPAPGKDPDQRRDKAGKTRKTTVGGRRKKTPKSQSDEKEEMPGEPKKNVHQNEIDRLVLLRQNVPALLKRLLKSNYSIKEKESGQLIDVDVNDLIVEFNDLTMRLWKGLLTSHDVRLSPPTEEQCRAIGMNHELTEDEARYWWAARTSRGWLRRTGKRSYAAIVSLDADCVAFTMKTRDGAKQNGKLTPTGSDADPDRYAKYEGIIK